VKLRLWNTLLSTNKGLITNEERYAKIVEVWKKIGEEIESKLDETLAKSESTLQDDLKSGARASLGQVNKMSGMLGLMLSPTGRIIELPVRSNYKDGLGVLEYFISTHGARKGLTRYSSKNFRVRLSNKTFGGCSSRYCYI
jgi:DNA-directed RNA polymerase beta' subunit